MNAGYLAVWFLANLAVIALYLVFRRRIPAIRRQWLSCFIFVLKCVAAAAAGAALIVLGEYRTPFLAAAQILLVGDCISDLILAVLYIAFRRQRDRLRNIHKKGYLAAAMAMVLIVYGFINMQFVKQTNYSISSDQLQHRYRIVYLSDVHYGTSQDLALLENTVKRINDLDADIIIFGGDISDEYTSEVEMKQLYGVLGGLESTYGNYFVYGNHDEQLPDSHMKRTYSDDELKETIDANGITILCDDVEEINNDLLLVGRGNASRGGRKELPAYLAMASDPDERYCVLLDHQPMEWNEASESGFDLMLSGHLHAGQLFPVGTVGRVKYPVMKGKTKIGDMTLIISSGLSGWGYPYRTESHCEYEVIDIQPK